MRCHIEGALSDLHAVEARYHRECMSLFFSNRNRKYEQSQSASATQLEIDSGLKHLITVMSSDKSRIWNSLELFQEYQNNHGSIIARRGLIGKLRAHFQDEFVVLSSPGYASIVAFHYNAAAALKMVKDDEDDDFGSNIGRLAKTIVKDCKDILFDTSKYKLDIDEHIAAEAGSSTLLTLLATLSPKLNKTLPALLIGNTVTSVLKNQAIALQVALGFLLRDSKTIVNNMYDYRVTCSYDELLRFKTSAAVAASSDPSKQGISDARQGLIQVVADNFDCDICSPNGKLSTHSLAMIVTQTGCRDLIPKMISSVSRKMS